MPSPYQEYPHHIFNPSVNCDAEELRRIFYQPGANDISNEIAALRKDIADLMRELSLNKSPIMIGKKVVDEFDLLKRR